ncbi:uncharacterized protein LOC119082528 [Bradysia coprophila]|uniref:uncharacterized protein LOC119082528 n=1 Tax=Bradysia coprophila TaxID=38358 RepID=UPI00187D8245|nr:uncharacterized protein LOC119082528 [Bradysia coprophila]
MNELGDSHPGPSPLDQLVAPQVQTDLLPITIIAPPTTPDKSSHLDIARTPGSVPIDSEELSHDLVNQGWRKYWSKTENQPYFWNKVSGESLWEMPSSNRFDLSTDPQNNEDVNFKIRSEINVLKEGNLKLKSENIEIKAENGTMQTKIDNLEAENIEIKTKIDNLEAENIEIKTKIDNLEAENIEIKTKIDNLEAENIEIKTKIDNLEAKVDELTRSFKFMVTKYNELEQRFLFRRNQAQARLTVSEEVSLTEMESLEDSFAKLPVDFLAAAMWTSTAMKLPNLSGPKAADLLRENINKFSKFIRSIASKQNFVDAVRNTGKERGFSKGIIKKMEKEAQSVKIQDNQ